jgi:hypothetical protein
MLSIGSSKTPIFHKAKMSQCLSLLLAFNAVVKLINFFPVNLFKVVLCLTVCGVTGVKSVVVLEELQILDLRVKPIFLKAVFNGLYYVRKRRLN